MEQYQPHNSIDPSLPTPPFFPSSASAITEPPPVDNFTSVPLPVPNQISYDEMILAAISALGEKDGSSRQAIAKYIDRVYTNLPSNHSVLLTNNLKKLKITGQLDMVKHSYLLPSRSTPPPPPPPQAANPIYTTTTTAYSFHPPPPPAPDPAPEAPLYTSVTTSGGTYFTGDMTVQNFPANTGDGLTTVPTSQPRKRGRPAKPKPDVALSYTAQNLAPTNGPVQAQYQGFINGPIGSDQNINGPVGVLDGPVEVSIKRKPGRPRKDKTSPAQYALFTDQAQTTSLPPPDPIAGSDPMVSGSEAMLVSLGLSDGPSGGSTLTKMRPRRMKKPTISVDQPLTDPKRKKRPGRPRKVQPAGVTLAPGVFPVQVPVGVAPAPVVSSGGRRGRPRKYAVVPAPGVVNGVQPKKRGRKPKNVTNGAFSVPLSFMLPEQMNGGGGGMIPQGCYVQDGGVVGDVVPVSGGYNGAPYQFTGKRGRGRPPRMGGSGGVMKPRKLSGKPLGRPRKNPTGSEDQSFAIKNLKDKIEYLQTKIIEAVPLIKACINAEEANAMEALGQLEELATMDLSAPVNVQIQQQPPPQQLQAELHSSNNGF